MAQKPVRIQDVAREAGVSTATVSRALSNPNMVSESTRNTVFEAVQITGFRINHAARNLRKQQAGAILVLVPDLGNPFFSQILSGIDTVFAGTDYSVLIADTVEQADRGNGLLAYFLDNRIDGMIILDGSLTRDELSVFASSERANRVVFACEWVDGEDFPSIRSDNERGAELAIDHLNTLGHRKIAHVTGPPGNILTVVRKDGMLEACATRGLDVPEEWILRGDFSLESGQRAAAEILAMKDRPTAVFCASDMMAFGLISGLSKGGLSVPDDISVIGFDDIEMSEFYVPGLTTVWQNRRRLGSDAAELLLRRLAGAPESDAGVTLVDVTLNIRHSTAAPSR